MAVQVLPTIDRLPEPLRRYMDGVTQEHLLLIVLKRELYEGDWVAMSTDLHNRLAGRPYVLRLAGRIEEDLKRIEQLNQLERHYQVDLADYVQPLQDVSMESHA